METQTNPLIVGSMSKNKLELRTACQLLTARVNFEYTIVKSDRSHFTIKCLSKDCPWRLHAFKVGDTGDGSFNEEHNCLSVQHLGHRQATKTFLKERIREKLRDQPKYRPKDIQQDIQREFGINIQYLQANRAKQRH